jgi:hypothetical protein
MSIKSQTPGIASDIPFNKKQRNPNYMMNKSEDKRVPLYHGAKARSSKGFSHNVEAEMHAGKKQDQAVAIAYSEARSHKKPNHKKSMEHHGDSHRHKEHR